MSEYRFENEAVLARGPTVFRVENRGSLPHSMTFVALPDDFPPIDEQLRGETRRPASAIARIPLRQPTGRGSFSVNLGPGRYALICFAEDSDGVQHALKGMSSELRVK